MGGEEDRKTFPGFFLHIIQYFPSHYRIHSNGRLVQEKQIHLVKEADYICDRISIIDQGKILAEGTTQFLKDNFGQLKTLEVEVSGSGSFTEKELRENIVGLENSRDLTVRENKITIVGKNMDRTLENLILYLNRIGSRAERINLRESSLDDVFLEVVSK